jgi:hypothetical protein
LWYSTVSRHGISNSYLEAACQGVSESSLVLTLIVSLIARDGSRYVKLMVHLDIDSILLSCLLAIPVVCQFIEDPFKGLIDL